MKQTFYQLLVLSILLAPAKSQVLRQVVDGLDDPLFLTHAGDGSNRLFVIERPGRIRIIRDGRLSAEPFLDISELVSTSFLEKGLLGLAFDPNFVENRRFFVYYTPNGPLRTRLALYRASVQNPDIAELQETVMVDFDQPQGNHNGGMIAFGPDGLLYVALGDGGGGGDPGGNGQNHDTVLGSLLRLDVSSDSVSIPPDNPFVGSAGRDEIWAYGLRNPWRFSFDRVDGRLFLGDVGQNTREEIDLIERGGNYGWNRMEGNLCFPFGSACDMTGLEPPIHDYTRGDGASVTGGYVYRGSRFSTLQGHYLFGDFITGAVWALEETLPGIWEREMLFPFSQLQIASFGEDESGELFILDLRGAVYEIVAQDTDEDGLPDEVEDAGANGGDANLDGIPDRTQGHVATFAEGNSVHSLITSPGLLFREVRRLDDPPAEGPEGLSFPFGFLGFELTGLQPGTEAAVTLLTPPFFDVNAYYSYGATPEETSAHWYDFSPFEGIGATVGTHSVSFRFQDGVRGDDDLQADGTLTSVGGPAIDPDGVRLSYFAQVGDGGAGDILLQTSGTFVNTGSEDEIRLHFYNSDSTPMNLDLGGLGSGPEYDITLPLGNSVAFQSSGQGDLDVGGLLVGYARIEASASVGGTLVFTRRDRPSGVVLYEAGMPATGTLLDFTVPVDSGGSRDTGLAIVNAPETAMPEAESFTTAHVTLRLYDSSFTLEFETTIVLADGEHRAGYPRDFFPALQGPPFPALQGTITVSSDKPLSVVTLRQTDAPGVEFPDEVPTLTTFPVLPGRADAPPDN